MADGPNVTPEQVKEKSSIEKPDSPHVPHELGVLPPVQGQKKIPVLSRQEIWKAQSSMFYKLLDTITPEEIAKLKKQKLAEIQQGTDNGWGTPYSVGYTFEEWHGLTDELLRHEIAGKIQSESKMSWRGIQAMNPDVAAAQYKWTHLGVPPQAATDIFNALLKAYETHPQELANLKEYLKETNGSDVLTVYRGTRPGVSITSRHRINVTLDSSKIVGHNWHDETPQAIEGNSRFDVYHISVDAVLAAGSSTESEIIVDADKLQPIHTKT